MSAQPLTSEERATLSGDWERHEAKRTHAACVEIDRRYEATCEALEARIEDLRGALLYIEPERDSRPHWAATYRAVAARTLRADDAKAGEA